MTWDRNRWNQHLRTVRSALAKRDALTGPSPQRLPAEKEQEAERERQAWAAKAQANLRQLAHLAQEAPDRSRALETFHELRQWYENPNDNGSQR